MYKKKKKCDITNPSFTEWQLFRKINKEVKLKKSKILDYAKANNEMRIKKRDF